jgi:hypothetical protein
VKIRTYKYIADKKFFIEIKTEEFSQNDLDLMQQFGEPEVNVGGLYGESEGPTSTWTAPSRFLRVKQGFQPFKAFFDSRNFGEEADDRANALIAKIIERIQAAMTVLRARQDTFTSEVVTNV